MILGVLGWCAFLLASIGYFVELSRRRTLHREAQRLHVELNLASERAQEAINAQSVDAMKALFQNAVCSRKNLCSELLLFDLYQSYQEAADGLERLARALDTAEQPSGSAIAWAQQTLSRILDKPIRLASPGDAELMLTKAMECYAALSRKVDDGPNLAEAVAQTRRCLDNPKMRKEAARNVLPALLTTHPDNQEILNLYDGLLRAEGPVSPETRDLVDTALYSMPTLSEVNANHLMRFLETGFGTATQSWKTFGTHYSNTITRILAMKQLHAAHLEELLKLINGYIQGQGRNLLSDARVEEYRALCSVIVAIHNAQGHDRMLRPKHRHVVHGEPGVIAKIELSGGNYQAAMTRVQNFAVSPREWCGGAWATTADEAAWPAAGDRDWRDATLTLHHPCLGAPLTFPVSVNGPHHENSYYGFRLRWPNISLRRAARLQHLAGQYPVTR